MDNTDVLWLSLARNELALLVSLVNERILAADEAGIAREDDSSLFREQLFLKLLKARDAHAHETPLSCPAPGPDDERSGL